MRFLRTLDIQIGERYYLLPFPTVAGLVVAVVVLVVVYYTVRRLAGLR